MKNKFLAVLAIGVCVFAIAGNVSAASITAHLTADNHYGLYYGNSTGSNMAYVGRNEVGAGGSGGGFNWSEPETFNFNTGAGDYIYVAAWDDGGPQMWTGDFEWGAVAGIDLVTDSTNWEYFNGSSSILSPSSAPPVTVGDLGTAVSTASWNSIGQALAYGTGPWGGIPGVNSSASYIWGDNTNSGNGFQIFRTKAPIDPVPEPATVALLGIGLVGLAGAEARRRRKKKTVDNS